MWDKARMLEKLKHVKKAYCKALPCLMQQWETAYLGKLNETSQCFISYFGGILTILFSFITGHLFTLFAIITL